MDGISLGNESGNQSMSCFVEGRASLLLFTDDHALSLYTHQDFVFGVFKILHRDFIQAFASGEKGSLVDEVCQICSRKSWSGTSDDL